MQDLHSFYVIVPPGLEELALAEMERKKFYFIASDGQPLNESPEVHEGLKGGFEISASLMFGLQLNFFMRTASRILLRIGHFQTTSFPQLEDQLRKLYPKVKRFTGGPFHAVVSCSESQLNNEKRVTQTLSKAFPLTDSETAPRLYFRIHHNRAELSLDTSGDHLHRRGWRQHHQGAPLRETLAAALVELMCSDVSASHTERVELVDPFVGTGTLLREFAERLQPLERKMAFLDWTGVPKIFKSDSFLKNYRLTKNCFVPSMIGLDQDGDTLQLAEKHLRPLVPNRIQSLALHQGDSTLFDPGPEFSLKPGRERWMICNPPYGERLAMNFDLQKGLEFLLSQWQVQRFALIFPSGEERKLNFSGYNRQRSFRTTNGGLPVTGTSFLLHKQRVS